MRPKPERLGEDVPQELEETAGRGGIGGRVEEVAAVEG
jgi:hypothetical protein